MPKRPLNARKSARFLACVPRQLSAPLLVPAAATATEINPTNRPHLKQIFQFLTRVLERSGLPGADEAATAVRESDSKELAAKIVSPQHVALLTTKYWGNTGVDLSVSFMERTVLELQNKILLYMNKWGERANVRFRGTASGGDVRISRGRGGYWSFLGTDVRHIPAGEQTMNLEGFTLKTPENEYERVVTHEAGHTLGCPHEHMRKDLVKLLDPQKTIDYFMSTQGWTAQEVREQVLTPLDETSLLGTPADQDSIMCYQIPGQCTRTGQPVRGGARINESDHAFMAKAYPKSVTPLPPPGEEYMYITVKVATDQKTASIVTVK